MQNQIYSLPRACMGELYDVISSEQQLYLPVMKQGQLQFALKDDGMSREDINLDQLLSSTSVKELFFPQTQDIAAFRQQGKQIEIIENGKSRDPFVVFGVRACDAEGLEVLDRVFLGESQDKLYGENRSKGTVVTLACNEPEETCFCSIFGIDAAKPGADVETWITGDTLFWRANTEKGEVLTRQAEGLLQRCDAGEPEVLTELKENIREITGHLPLEGLSLDRFKPEALQELFDSPAWQELSQPCIGCGTCTFVCPTCQCYDIRDFDTGNGIQRFRCWDSCMYSDFTTMAHGNPRTTQVERFRQRFMHKLVYYPAHYGGEYSCVGCGRCLSKCPNSMNMVKVIKTLGGTRHVSL